MTFPTDEWINIQFAMHRQISTKTRVNVWWSENNSNFFVFLSPLHCIEGSFLQCRHILIIISFLYALTEVVCYPGLQKTERCQNATRNRRRWNIETASEETVICLAFLKWRFKGQSKAVIFLQGSSWYTDLCSLCHIIVCLKMEKMHFIMLR